jgi:hypothetical protein
MKTKLHCLFIALALFAGIHQVTAQVTAFTYQGRLNNGGSPASGLYDFRFKLYVDPYGNTQVGSSYLTNAVPTTNGLFITTIDFGPGIFVGTTNWLEVDVRTNGGGGYTVLSPLQELTPTPNAVFAETAGSLSGVLPAAQLGGTILNSSLPASPNFGGTVQANYFSGNGAGVTNVNAAALNGLSASNFWQTGGNTVSAGQFLGSTNNQPLELWVNGARAFRLEPNTNSPNVIGGYAGNSVSGNLAYGATIGGGGQSGLPNSISGTNVTYATIGGGVANTINGTNAYHSTIGGGDNNSIFTYDAFIGGGSFNDISDSASYSAISGGYYNTVQGDATDTGKGFAVASVIAGGSGNQIQTNSIWSFIGGGGYNYVQPFAVESFIGGGYQNVIQGNSNYWATLYVVGNTIVGGAFNLIQSNTAFAFIGGGEANQNGGFAATIVGGGGNSIQTNNSYSFIGGGSVSVIETNASYSVIGGGENNVVLTNAYLGTIGGGANNQVGGAGGTVPGGNGNFAGGINSFAAGTDAYATNNGSFVLADLNYVPFYSTANNQLSARFGGGIAFVTGGAGMTLDGQSVLTSGNSNAVNLTNSANSFTGNGGGLTGVNAATLNGFSSGSFAPASGSAGYIQNSVVSQAASFNITGNARISGLIRSGSETGTSDAPSPAGLVIRRVNSLSNVAGNVVARTDVLTLERDGSNQGLLIRYPAGGSERQTINCVAQSYYGTNIIFHTTLFSPLTPGTIQLLTSAQHAIHAEISFGDIYDSGHLTQVVLDRYDDGSLSDFYWVGTVTSTYNQ